MLDKTCTVQLNSKSKDKAHLNLCKDASQCMFEGRLIQSDEALNKNALLPSDLLTVGMENY